MYTTEGDYGFEKVLYMLRNHGEGYLSGQDLSCSLKISRVAVWKHVRRIRALGYKVESRRKLGYRLAGPTSRPLPWEICRGLDTQWIGKKIYYFDTIGSTQDFALGAAQDGGENGTVVIAQRQTGARGRMNRRWISPRGGVWMSVVFHPKDGFASATLFPLAASVALADAITDTLGVTVDLKWPNDVLVGGKKACGILVDVSMTSNRIDHMVLGAGINFDVPAGAIEKAAAGSENYSGAASLVSPAGSRSPVPLVQSFLAGLEKAFESLAAGRDADIVRQWTDRSSTIGRDVTVSYGGKKIRGSAVRIDADGALVLNRGGDTHRILAGDASQ